MDNSFIRRIADFLGLKVEISDLGHCRQAKFSNGKIVFVYRNTNLPVLMRQAKTPA